MPMIGTHDRVEGDLYDISARLKEIDSAYFVVRNYRLKRFELHASDQKGGTLALVLPFDRLDARTLHLVRKTRAERVEALIRQMEESNARLQKLEEDALMEKIRKASESANEWGTK